MQTFLPYAEYAKSAQVLDRERLNKQRSECKQILRALSGLTAGWVNHPAVRMWRGSERSLIDYSVAICVEQRLRGYEDSLLEELRAMSWMFSQATAIPPSWLGDVQFHTAHRSNLIRKLPGHYAPMWPGVPNNLPYVWPRGRY